MTFLNLFLPFHFCFLFIIYILLPTMINDNIIKVPIHAKFHLHRRNHQPDPDQLSLKRNMEYLS